MIVDAHLHVWDPRRITYAWLDDGPLHRPFTIGDVSAGLHDAGVAAAVLVQAADSAAETAFLLEVAAHHDVVAGVVGWMPLDDPDAMVRALAERDPRIVGVRTLIHDRPDPDWIVSDAVRPGLDALADAGLPYDVVTADPAALGHLPTLGERHPTLRLVIDHLGKPPVGGSDGDRRAWRALLAAAAENPLTHAKLSGLAPATTDPAASLTDAVRPFIDDALELFGPQRLMIGSDWPISSLTADVAAVWTAIDACLSGLGDRDRAAVRGGTATTFYRLDERNHP